MCHALIAMTALFGLVVASTSPSQTTPGSGAQPPASAAPDTELQEVVVTAQRREGSVQRTAVPISMVGGEQLVLAGGGDSDEQNLC
jgi:outer membrane receptor protein involved in Fe transport